jgi:hypothetical protein
METMLARLAGRQHLAAALLSIWLIVTSPWISMLRRVPRDASLLEYSHIVLGLAALVLAITYTLSCTRGGRWRLYFPWAAGQPGDVWRDIAGLLRGRIPAAEGGGLFALIEGLLLVLFLVTAVTGAAWSWNQGTSDAIAWRGHHILAARGFAGLLVLHVISASLHLLDFVRD